MIKSKKELNFYIQADRMMNRGVFSLTLKQKLKDFLYPHQIMRLLFYLRKTQYYKSNGGGYKYLLYRYLYEKKSVKLGISIGSGVDIGYGLVIPHYGTIVVGSSNKIGNYSVLHTSTCISDNGKVIGDALYLATGAKLTSKLTLGDNVSVGANSLVNKSFVEGNCMIAGSPAKRIKDAEPWYIRDGQIYTNRVLAIEKLKKELNI